jgi:WD40 repeat protein
LNLVGHAQSLSAPAGHGKRHRLCSAGRGQNVEVGPEGPVVPQVKAPIREIISEAGGENLGGMTATATVLCGSCYHTYSRNEQSTRPVPRREDLLMRRAVPLLSWSLLLLLGGVGWSAESVRAGDDNPLPEGALLRLGTTRFRHPGDITALALAPDGKAIVVGGADDFVRVVDASTGREVRQLKASRRGEVANVARLEFSTDGKAVAAGNFSGPIHVWDPTSGKLIAEISRARGEFGPFSFSADAKRLAAAAGPYNQDANRVFVFETATGKQLTEVRVLHSHSLAVALSPDGKVLATAGQAQERERNETVQLWDVGTSKELRRLRLEGGWRGALTFAPDGRSLAAGLRADEMALFDVGSGKELRRFVGRHGLGESIVFSPDSRVLAAANSIGMVYAWDAASGKRLALFQAPRRQVCPAFAPGGRLLALTGDRQMVRVWDVLAEKELTPPGGHPADVAGLTFVAGGKELLSLSADGGVCRWDAVTGREVGQVTLDDGVGRWSESLFAGTWLAPDGQLALVEGAPVTTLTLYELRRGRAVCSFPGPHAHEAVKVPAAFSADGNLLAFGSLDLSGGVGPLAPASVVLVDANTGQELHALHEHKGGVVDLAFAPDGKTLVSLGLTQREKTPELYAWDTRTGKPLWHDGAPGLQGIAFSPAGRLLATASGDGVALRDPATGRRLRELPRASGAMTFSPDGRLLALSSHAGDTERHQLYEVDSGTLRQEFVSAAGVGVVAFSPDSQRLATGGPDTTILVWDLLGAAEPGQGKLTAEWAGVWAALKDREGRAGLKAIRRLRAAPDEAVALLARHVKPVEAKSAPDEVIARWIAALDAEHFNDRQKAARELEGLGRAAEQPLRKALAGKPSPEARRRLEDLLDRLADPGPSPEALRLLRAMEVLEGIGTPVAREVLEALAGGAPEARLTQEAKAALRRLDRRPAVRP